jgi:hypothetical protein
MSATTDVIEAARRVWDRCGLIVKDSGETRVIVTEADMTALRDALKAYDASRGAQDLIDQCARAAESCERAGAAMKAAL